MPTTSARGLLIKVAIAAEARSLDEGDKSLTKEAIFEQPWIGEDLLPPLLADLRAMVRASA